MLTMKKIRNQFLNIEKIGELNIAMRFSNEKLFTEKTTMNPF